MLIRVDATLSATLPTLATKAELAELRAEFGQLRADVPTKAYLWAVLAVLVAAYAAGLAGIAVIR